MQYIDKYACVPPLIYIAMDCIMRYVFSLRVFKQMDAQSHTHVPAFIHYFTHTHSRARIYSLFLTLTRGKTMYSHDQILINPKSYGLVHDVCENMCLLYGVCRCIDLKVQLITAVSAVLPNHLPRMCG